MVIICVYSSILLLSEFISLLSNCQPLRSLRSSLIPTPVSHRDSRKDKTIFLRRKKTHEKQVRRTIHDDTADDPASFSRGALLFLRRWNTVAFVTTRPLLPSITPHRWQQFICQWVDRKVECRSFSVYKALFLIY